MAGNIIIDGSNICSNSGNQSFSIQRLEECIDAVTALSSGVNPRVYVDASLRWKILQSERDRLNSLIASGKVVQAPAGIPADDFILIEANTSGAIVISNDSFRPYHDMYPWLVEKRSGRLVGAVMDERTRTWTFLERNPGNDPARSLKILVDQWVPTPAASTSFLTAKAPSIETQYRMRVTRNDPSAVVLLVDQSGSMEEKWNDGTGAKSEQVAQIVNSAVNNLLLESKEGNEYKDYFDIAVIGFGGSGDGELRSMLPSSSLANPFLRLSEVAEKVPATVETLPNGRPVRIRRLVEPVSEGVTPLRQAFEFASRILQTWVEKHPNSYPPTVICVTDGVPTDGPVVEAANDLCGLSTNDGNVLLFVAHISEEGGQVLYPSALGPDRDEFAHEMFSISSVLPASIVRTARERGIQLGPNARGFLFNAVRDEVAQLINIGTMTYVLRGEA